MNITVIILTKNSEETIKETLSSVSFADEIIIVDDYSTDKTLAIASDFKSVIFQHKLKDDFSQQRNFGLMHAKNEWVFFVDSDEIVPPKLAKEIKRVVSTTTCNGFLLKRFDVLWGKTLRHGEVGSLRLLRLGRKGSGKWTGTVHEKWNITGKTESLTQALLHFPHQSIGEFLREVNMYSSIRADELYKHKTPVSMFTLICYPVGKFFLNYFLKGGFLDGIQGLLVCIIMSFHSFLVRSKLWQLYDQKKINTA